MPKGGKRKNAGRPKGSKNKLCSICSRKIRPANKSGLCYSCSKKGRTKAGNGYIWILSKNHPNAMKNSYVLGHRLVMEKCLGRYLTKAEVVHHENNVRDDNRLENLLLFPSNKVHICYHGNGIVEGGGNTISYRYEGIKNEL